MLLVRPLRREPSTGILFLHTPGANFALEGWLFAECVRRANALTLCPSMGLASNWQTRHGMGVLRAAIQSLKRLTVQRIYLSATAAGVPGLLRIAAATRAELAGLILISGIDSSCPPPPLPTLILRGIRDAVTPAAHFHKYARKALNCTLRELPGDQFLLSKQRTAVGKAISLWLRDQAP
jgi:hypothetical protein